ncbi:MAG: Na+/H+ antiporter subunit E [Chloroflexota bacterium]
MRQDSFFPIFLLNILLAVGWAILTGDPTGQGYTTGFVIGFAILALLEEHYAQKCFLLVRFIAYILVEIVLSAIQLGWNILTPNLNQKLSPVIVGVPLELTNELGIITLASVITLIPGTLTVDLSMDEEQGHTLFVHSLYIREPAEVQSYIKDNFERRILDFYQS